MLTADDRALLREVFRAARARNWTRDHYGPCGREPGSRYWSEDRDTHVELDKNGWLKTPISEVECVTVELAVDMLVAVGVLPMHLSSAHRAAEQMAYGAVREQIRLLVAEWYDGLHTPVERGWAKAEKRGYINGVAETVDAMCDVVGDEHPLWEEMAEIADAAQAVDR